MDDLHFDAFTRDAHCNEQRQPVLARHAFTCWRHGFKIDNESFIHEGKTMCDRILRLANLQKDGRVLRCLKTIISRRERIVLCTAFICRPAARP